jgi:prolyl 4-hydroxylase
MLEEWTEKELTKISLYGIRKYTTNSVLTPHVDRMPLVELWGHDGKADNVTMEVGDMLMYESHSVVHGRPWSLKGKYLLICKYDVMG